MKGIYLLLGSNIGNSQKNLARARELIQREIGQVMQHSHVYRSAAWGYTDQPDFLNQVIRIETGATAQALLNKINKIENTLGRERTGKWRARVIDIDILYYNDELIDTVDLKIPHPEIPNRRFTLVPLCEIAENEIHPALKKSQLRLLQECRDQLSVERLDL